MGDEKPFAVYDTERDAVLFDGRDVSEWEGASVAQAVNGVIDAERRKAAAKALRALAESVRCATGVRDPKPSDPFWRDYFATVAETQASLIEGGAT